jgi:hypothetical protein
MMNPGPTEAGIEVAGSIVDGLKSNPLCLAFLAMNMALLALLAYIAYAGSERRAREVQLIYDNEKEVREMLSKCIVPGP